MALAEVSSLQEEKKKDERVKVQEEFKNSIKQFNFRDFLIVVKRGTNLSWYILDFDLSDFIFSFHVGLSVLVKNQTKPSTDGPLVDHLRTVLVLTSDMKPKLFN